MTITKELIEQWAGDAGFWTKDWMTTAVLEVAQRAAAYGAEQREAELMAVGVEPVASHTEKGFSQDAGLIWEETNLYSAEQLASARLQGAEEERKKWQDNLHANVEYCPTCCKGKIASPDMTRDEVIFHCGKTSGRLEAERSKQAEPVNQWLLDAAKYAVDVDDDYDKNAPEHRCYVPEAFSDSMEKLRAAIAAAEQAELAKETAKHDPRKKKNGN